MFPFYFQNILVMDTDLEGHNNGILFAIYCNVAEKASDVVVSARGPPIMAMELRSRGWRQRG